MWCETISAEAYADFLFKMLKAIAKPAGKKKGGGVVWQTDEEVIRGHFEGRGVDKKNVILGKGERHDVLTRLTGSVEMPACLDRWKKWASRREDRQRKLRAAAQVAAVARRGSFQPVAANRPRSAPNQGRGSSPATPPRCQSKTSSRS